MKAVQIYFLIQDISKYIDEREEKWRESHRKVQSYWDKYYSQDEKSENSDNFTYAVYGDRANIRSKRKYLDSKEYIDYAGIAPQDPSRKVRVESDSE